MQIVRRSDSLLRAETFANDGSLPSSIMKALTIQAPADDCHFYRQGSGDAQGSERGLEYDTMSGVYAEFVEKEVVPLVETQTHAKLTKDPDGRATVRRSL